MYTTNLNALKLLVISFAIFLHATPSYANDNLTTQKQALGIIAEFADNLCKEVPLKGSGSNLELSGQAKADLNSFIGKIADLGIEGAAKYKKSEYLGLLQKDLLEGYKSNTDCRVHVFNDLSDKLITSHPDRTGPSHSVNQHSTGDDTINIGTVQGGASFSK